MANIWLSYNGNALGGNGYSVGIDGTPPEPMPVKTVRFMFEDSSYDPTQAQSWVSGSTWDRVSGSPNVWDYGNTSNQWRQVFKDKFTSGSYVHVIDGNLSGVSVIGDYIGGGLFENNTRLRTAVLRGLQDVRTEVSSSDKRGIERTFWGCSNLTSCSLTGFAGCTRYLFANCGSLTAITLSDFHPTYAAAMFGGCTSIVNAPSFDASSLIEANGLFNGCSALENVPSYSFGSSLREMNSMFMRCTTLRTVPAFNTSSVTIMSSAFFQSGIIVTPNWDTRNVTDFRNMFAYCSSLATIGSLDTGNANDVSNMFTADRQVTSGALALYTQMSSQSVPPPIHGGCFSDCGSSTTTGAAELAQIPTSWGGTMS